MLQSLSIGLSILFLNIQLTQAKQEDKDSFTFVNASGQCMLYFKRAYLTVINDTKKLSQRGGSEVYQIPLQNQIIEQPKTMECKDHSGVVTLNLKGGKGGPYNHTLDSLSLRMTIKSDEALLWWSVDKIDLKAKGSVMPDGKEFTISFNRTKLRQFVEGPKFFAYACGKHEPLSFPGKIKTVLSGSKKEEIVLVKYALQFEKLQVQPFVSNQSISKKWYGFTDDVYDCVPFMSIGVWMFLLCGSLLLCIVLSGVSMLTSLKTNDRFDDIKGKPLVVNVKD